MKKIELLLNELSNIKIKNLIKLIITEMITLFLAFGIFLTDISSQFKIMIFGVLLLLSFVMFVLYIKKQKMISYCKHHYQSDSLDVITLLEKRKKYFLDSFDSTNETLIFKEILRTLKTYKKYQDNNEIGPWEIIYNHHKTKSFSDKLVVKEKTSIQKFTQMIEEIPSDVKQLLLKLGIDYHKIYDTWERKLGGNPHLIELMYPVFGLILNDSQVLNHGLRYQVHQINENTTLKLYETQMENEDVIMIHIRIKL